MDERFFKFGMFLWILDINGFASRGEEGSIDGCGNYIFGESMMALGN